MTVLKQAYPLQWPVGYKRTSARRDSAFKQTPGDTQNFLKKELTRLGAKEIIVSSNAQLQKDGSMYADAMMRHGDPGVAVYFNYKTKPVVLCCDTYNKIWENVYAVGKTIENLRAIERYGVSDFLARSFTGFAELPEAIQMPFKKSWWEILGVDQNADKEEIKKAYRLMVEKTHPDRGGNNEAFHEVRQAYEQSLKS